MVVTVGTMTGAHSLKSQVGIGSESHCLLGELKRILESSDSAAGLEVEKSGGLRVEKVREEMPMWRY